jgi:ligand-binding SRPBCC domain-containing protein
MAAYLLRTTTIVPLELERVFSFFSDARNLDRITPPWLHFQILTDGPHALRPGSLLDYRLRLHGIPFRWQTEIVEWNPPRGFVDHQRQGPYHWWHHTHRFAAVEGGTEVDDVVHYSPRGGALVHALFVARDLRRIFRYRHLALHDALGVLPTERPRVTITRAVRGTW